MVISNRYFLSILFTIILFCIWSCENSKSLEYRSDNYEISLLIPSKVNMIKDSCILYSLKLNQTICQCEYHTNLSETISLESVYGNFTLLTLSSFTRSESQYGQRGSPFHLYLTKWSTHFSSVSKYDMDS